MEHKLLVLCDLEEDYAQQMSEFLRRSKMYPIDWTIPVFKTLTIRQQVLKETLVFEQN